MPFADLLVVHELAHAFHDGVPFVFPRSWLMELFANMALCAVVVANEPDRTVQLETLPRVALENGLLKPVARDAFALSDEQLAGVLGGRVHPAAGQWLASWNEVLGHG